ncbi:MAG TPA: hypothetical protein VL098_12830 [Flavipsychrobacter sp.]|nr:hypothetical protein [Flavipsychrobacter sp.]
MFRKIHIRSLKIIRVSPGIITVAAKSQTGKAEKVTRFMLWKVCVILALILSGAGMYLPTAAYRKTRIAAS